MKRIQGDDFGAYTEFAFPGIVFGTFGKLASNIDRNLIQDYLQVLAKQ